MANLPSHQDRRRRILLDGLEFSQLNGLEIGAADDPLVRKSDGPVSYVDHATRGELVAKYTGNPHIRADSLVDVDVVWGKQSLAELIGTEVADYAIASHVVEHVPDLVGWLREIEAVLKPGGQLLLIVPDKRMSYDCKRRETGLIEVLDAFVRQAKWPQPYQLLDCALGVVTSDPNRMHIGEASAADFKHIHTIDSALQLARHALQYGEYIDIHCWSFTPKSFAGLMGELVRHDLIKFACSGLVETDPESNFEFFVKLQAGQTKAAAIESWRRAEQSALPHIQGSAAALDAEAASRG